MSVIVPVGVRSRWVAVGAVVALVLGAGGVLTSSAAAPGSASSFVPITSCRLLDTRPEPDNVGARNGALTAEETLAIAVRGTNGRCVIPGDATSVSMNVTIVSPSSTSFLTVFPSDASPRPLASSMNWVARQAPTANAVTSPLSADGRLSFYNLSGTVDLVVDIVGYYVPSTSGPQGPAGADGEDAPRLANVVHVSSSGGDFTSVAAALTAIGTTLPAASASNPYLIRVGPGVFTNPGNVPITLEDHVDIEGAGPGTTILRCACTDETVRALGEISIEIRHLSIENTSPTDAEALLADGAVNTTAVTLRDVELSHPTGTALNAIGVRLVLDGVRTQALNGLVINWSEIAVDDSTLTGTLTGVFLSQVSGVISNSTVTGSSQSIWAFVVGRLRVIDTGLDRAPLVGTGTVQCIDLWNVSTGATISC